MEKNQKENTKGNKMFFIAVGISLIMILIACIVSYPQVIPKDIDNQLADGSETTSTQETETTNLYNAVDNLVTNVPKDTTVTSTPNDVNKSTTAENTTINTIKKEENSPNVVSDNSPIMPISNGEVLNEFSNGELVKSATSGIWQTHNGIDILAEVNTPVQAVEDGTITKVYEDALLGFCVTIDHTDFIANYCNLDAGVIVSEGDTINKGSILGTVGNTSVSESALESHLHFETIQGGKFVNPLDIIE